MTTERPGRVTRSFPTRTYGAALVAPLEANALYRWVIGLDPAPVKLDAAEIGKLNDPFSMLLLRRGVFAMTARDLIEALERQANALPVQRSFLVGDGGHIPFIEAPALDRQLRFAITRGTANEAELMISSSRDLGSDDAFLQLLAWDPVAGGYNYYMRQKPAWIFSGSSAHALCEPSRGRGCFDSHVNGSLVMKELKAPWNNWHSQAAAIEAAIAPDDPIRREPLFIRREGAENLEQFVVRPGVGRWNAARIKRDVAPDGSVRHGRWLLRQVLDSTSVNLTSSSQKSALVAPKGELSLPITFFLDADGLFGPAGLAPNVSQPKASGAWYLASLQVYESALADDAGFRRPGDTHFAFLVPERAYEDLDVLDKLVLSGVLSTRLAAALLMVDFPNPIYSARRASLLRHVPDEFAPTAATANFATVLANGIVAAARSSPAGSPEREVAAALEDANWQQTFERRIEKYMDTVRAQLATRDGFDAYVRLAESRRREFKKLPLKEFTLTLPVTNIPAEAPLLQMNEDGTVTPKKEVPSP
jgi:hypothetical protein